MPVTQVLGNPTEAGNSCYVTVNHSLREKMGLCESAVPNPQTHRSLWSVKQFSNKDSLQFLENPCIQHPAAPGSRAPGGKGRMGRGLVSLTLSFVVLCN